MEKPRKTIGCIGQQDHGKTSLMIAMAGRAKAKGYKTQWSADYGIVRETTEMINKTEYSLKDSTYMHRNIEKC